MYLCSGQIQAQCANYFLEVLVEDVAAVGLIKVDKGKQQARINGDFFDRLFLSILAVFAGIFLLGLFLLAAHTGATLAVLKCYISLCFKMFLQNYYFFVILLFLRFLFLFLHLSGHLVILFFCFWLLFFL